LHFSTTITASKQKRGLPKRKLSTTPLSITKCGQKRGDNEQRKKENLRGDNEQRKKENYVNSLC
jgi:hypothetical protein